MEIKQHYSIIIPIYNEFKFLPELISGLKIFYHQGHEVVIVDDGSTDGSKSILEGCNFINLIKLPKNQGKGIAIKVGIQEAINERIVLFDGDLELDLDEISKLFILNRNKKVYSAMGYRFNHLNPFKSSFHWGNFMFTTFFNILHSTHHKDILCCAKSFYVNDLNLDLIQSRGFGIDVELSSILSLKCDRIYQVRLKYKRRDRNEGKKLKISDGWDILFQIIKMVKFF